MHVSPIYYGTVLSILLFCHETSRESIPKIVEYPSLDITFRSLAVANAMGGAFTHALVVLQCYTELHECIQICTLLLRDRKPEFYSRDYSSRINGSV